MGCVLHCSLYLGIYLKFSIGKSLKENHHHTMCKPSKRRGHHQSYFKAEDTGNPETGIGWPHHSACVHPHDRERGGAPCFLSVALFSTPLLLKVGPTNTISLEC